MFVFYPCLTFSSYCLRVSKTWKRFLESSAATPLWSEQYFDFKPEGTNRPVKLKVMQKYLVTYPSGHLRSLFVDNCAKFVNGEDLFRVLRACPQLEDLALSGRLVVSGDMPPIQKMPKLKFLFLGPHINLRPHHLDGMIEAAANTLVELNVLGFPSLPYSNQELKPVPWPKLPKLDTIRISGPANINPIAIDMGSIMKLTPNVHTVWVEHVGFAPSTPPQEAEDEEAPDNEQPPAPVWPNLQRLYIGPGVWIPPESPFPVLGESITELVVEGSSLAIIFVEPAAAADPRAVAPFLYPNVTSSFPKVMPSLPRLETLVLSARYPLTPEAFRALAGPALENDTLRHLHLAPFPWAALHGRWAPAVGPLADWAGGQRAAATDTDNNNSNSNSNKDGSNKDGSNKDGSNKDGSNKDGSNKDGSNKDGSNKNGSNKDGSNNDDGNNDDGNNNKNNNNSSDNKRVGLTSLGVNGLSGEAGGLHVVNAEAALLDVVAAFPGLRELDVGREAVAPEVLGRVLADGVHTLYHDRGAQMLDLRSWAWKRDKVVVQGGHPAMKPGSRFMRPGAWLGD
jgi:hypothetical protein